MLIAKDIPSHTSNLSSASKPCFKTKYLPFPKLTVLFIHNTTTTKGGAWKYRLNRIKKIMGRCHIQSLRKNKIEWSPLFIMEKLKIRLSSSKSRFRVRKSVTCEKGINSQ